MRIPELTRYAVLLLLVGCRSGGAGPGPVTEAAPESADEKAPVAAPTASPWRTVSMGAERWGALGCDLVGETRTEAGRLERADPAAFKKPFFGEWLVREDGERWVLSYGPSPEFDPFVGTDVILRGRACNKLGQALVAQHFHVDGIRSAGE